MIATAPITSEEYLALPDEFDQWGNRIKDELIRGEVVKYPIQPLSHDLPRTRVAEALIRYLNANEHIELTVLITTGFLVSKYDTFVPDVSVVKNRQLGSRHSVSFKDHLLSPLKLSLQPTRKCT